VADRVGTMVAREQAGSAEPGEGDAVESSVPLLAVVVLAAERTVGEAIAAGLSRRGCDARALPLDGADGAQADAWVLDVSAASRLAEIGIASVIGELTGRRVLLSDAGRVEVGFEVDAVVRFNATFDVLLAAIQGHGDPGGTVLRAAGDGERSDPQARRPDASGNALGFTVGSTARFGTALDALRAVACQ
jgi:hypothetical protein